MTPKKDRKRARHAYLSPEVDHRWQLTAVASPLRGVAHVTVDIILSLVPDPAGDAVVDKWGDHSVVERASIVRDRPSCQRFVRAERERLVVHPGFDLAACETRISLFLNFSYVCPEPVLVK